MWGCSQLVGVMIVLYFSWTTWVYQLWYTFAFDEMNHVSVTMELYKAGFNFFFFLWWSKIQTYSTTFLPRNKQVTHINQRILLYINQHKVYDNTNTTMTINYSEQIKQMMKQSRWEITTTKQLFPPTQYQCKIKFWSVNSLY